MTCNGFVGLQRSLIQFSIRSLRGSGRENAGVDDSFAGINLTCSGEPGYDRAMRGVLYL